MTCLTHFRCSAQSVPIPLVTSVCNKQCCTRTFLPLTAAYARTIHKFQGLSAGPVDPGKIKNMYECIVCDPDCKKYEGKASGLFYTAVSRATTLGDDYGLGSAIYFTGSELNEERITKIGIYAPPKSGPMLNFSRRDTWVKHLESNTKSSSLDRKARKRLIKWCKQNRVTFDQLDERIKQYTTEESNRKRRFAHV